MQKNIDTEIENELNSSQIFKFGLKILKKRRINELEKENTLVEALDSKTEPKVSHTVAEMLNTSRLDGTSRTIYVSYLKTCSLTTRIHRADYNLYKFSRMSCKNVRFLPEEKKR